MHTHIQNFLAGLRLRDDGVPIYVQIRQQFLAAIADRRLPPGSRLPTMREVAVGLRVDLNTVRHAYDALARGGAVTLVRGRGSFVADQPPPPPAADHQIEALAQSVVARASEANVDPLAVARRIIAISKGASPS